jgi:CheY-like chemotaxis protein
MKKTDNKNTPWILIAEDDPDDRLLISDAFQKSEIACHLEYVGDGESLISYLHESQNKKKQFSDSLPDLILLDLNMPGKDGRQALKEIKSDNHLKAIPVVVLSTSRSEEDIAYSYKTGANSYITKPESFHALVKTFKTLTKYWFESTILPN